ncbi:MAG: hypothetical protein NTW19_03130, partial [Planctomycetota bacterium]|nr:hypothetical protein [Planctomycetota bacterium]
MRSSALAARVAAILLPLLLAFAPWGAAPARAAVPSAPAKEFTFVLQEYLGHAWPADFVSRSIDAHLPGGIAPDHAELLIDGQPAPFQLEQLSAHADGTIRHAQLTFRTDLPAKAKRTVTLRAAEKPNLPPAADGELKATKQGNIVELSNGLVSVRLPLGKWSNADDAKSVAPSLAQTAASLNAFLALPADAANASAAADSLPGPLLGVKLPSGKWTAATRLKSQETFNFDPPLIQKNGPDKLGPDAPAGRLLGLESTLLSEGPLVARVRVAYRFEREGSYTIDVALRRGEPMVRIDERYEKAGALVIPFGSGFQPNKAVYNCFKVEPLGRTIPIAYDKPGDLGMFVGWNFYFQRIAPALLFVGDAGGDQLALLSTETDWLPF